MAGVLFQCNVSVYRISHNTEKLVTEDAFIQINQEAKYTYSFNIYNKISKEVLVQTEISSVQNPIFDKFDLTFKFSVECHERTAFVKTVFHNEPDLTMFLNNFVQSLFKHQYKRNITSEDAQEIDNFVDCMEQKNEVEEDENDEIFGTEQQHALHSKPSNDGGSNILLRVGLNTGNTMVMRKYNDRCSLGLFTSDRNCAFRMSLNALTDDSGRIIDAIDMLTNKGDHGLYILDSTRQNEIYDLNLDRGLVTNHIVCMDASNTIQEITGMLHSRAGHTSDPVFVAYNTRNTMSIDTRVPKAVVNHSDYKSNNGFTCGKTTRNGRLAMAAKNGVVRLYREPCRTRATVNFNVNCGEEPITSIDISPDEGWILTTSPSYLSVFCVVASSTGKLAFDAPMKQDKPAVIRLALHHSDAHAISSSNGGVLPPFTNGKFECKGTQVVAIVAGIGNALVSWGFRGIEIGKNPRYSITTLQTGECIVDDHPFESSYDVLYIAPNQVSVAERRLRSSW